MAVHRHSPAQRFGVELRRQRERAGISQTELAKKLLTSQTSVSDFELGKKRPKREVAAELDGALTAEGAVLAAWDSVFREYEPPEWYRKLPELETRATEIQEYHPLLVPGLLQTDDYARASIKAGNSLARADYVRAKVRERADRQRLLDTEDPPMFRAVIDETVLRRRLGDDEIMRGQLDHLVEVSYRDALEVLVVPADTLDHPGLDSGFILLRVEETGVLLYQETRAGGGIVPEREKVDRHVSLMAELRGVALPPRESRRLIEKVRGELQ